MCVCGVVGLGGFGCGWRCLCRAGGGVRAGPRQRAGGARKAGTRPLGGAGWAGAAGAGGGGGAGSTGRPGGGCSDRPDRQRRRRRCRRPGPAGSAGTDLTRPEGRRGWCGWWDGRADALVLVGVGCNREKKNLGVAAAGCLEQQRRQSRWPSAGLAVARVRPLAWRQGRPGRPGCRSGCASQRRDQGKGGGGQERAASGGVVAE